MLSAPLPEALDQLFLLPERALGMDSVQLRQDLAGLDFSNVQLLHTAPQGNVWLSGAAPTDASQRQSARSAAARGHSGTLHWFAYVGQEAESLHNENVSSDANALGPEDADVRAADSWADAPGRDGLSQKERDERLRALKDRQNEERQKKLEELKQQALAAQKFREQKEEERRQRMDELRQRDNDRRHQVEERKRQIWEAERDRREAILRKNQEREARIDSKRKNERSSIVFAFGSSTPRMLEPADTGGSFWGTRRATSTTNVMMFTAAPLTRRASERELDGSKKRATSASGLDRKPGEGEEVDSPSGGAAYSASARVNRRKTDLMPTIPSPRDLTPTSAGSRPPSAHPQQNSRPFSRSPGLRSGEVTPSPPSRPLSALSQQSVNSVNSGAAVNLRPRPLSAPRRPRPISIAVTGVSQEPPTTEHAARTAHRHISSAVRCAGIAGEVRAAKAQSSSLEREGAKPPLPKVHSAKKQPGSKPETPAKKPTDKVLKSAKASPRVTPKATPLQSPGSEAPPALLQDAEIEPGESGGDSQVKQPTEPADEMIAEGAAVEVLEEAAVTKAPEVVQEAKEEVTKAPIVKEDEPTTVAPPEKKEEPQSIQKLPEALEPTETEVDMTASMIAKTRITTEEEAKAALAERRRLAREQAEREAELERQRQEEEQRREEERQRQEEEDQRRFEEEQLHLVEEARRAEEERLLQAIQENEKREEEERKRREEEVRMKAEKEEMDKKAREEAERLRREMDERLKKEEEERIARRKRVEAIMLRTRGKGATPTGTPTKGQPDGDGDMDDGKDDSPSEECKPAPGDEQESESVATASGDTTQENGQQGMVSPPRLNNSELLLIDNSNVIKPMEISEDLMTMTTSATSEVNGHRNGMQYSPVDFVNVDNVKQYNNTTNNLLDLSEFDAFSTNNQPAVTETTGEFEQILDLANEDNMNSNVTSNGPAAPFIAFQDSLGKKQDTSVTDLLS